METLTRKERIKRKIHYGILAYGLIAVGLQISLMFYTWMRAYFSPGQRLLLTVNGVGEANPEFVLTILLYPWIMYTVGFFLLQVKKNWAKINAQRNISFAEEKKQPTADGVGGSE